MERAGEAPPATTLPPRIVLIGYRGSGKTTVGQALAARLGWTLTDADAALVARAGRSIRSIFETEGEEAFRRLESEVLAELLTVSSAVIATGGGVVTRPVNRERLSAERGVVFLRASVETIAARLRGDATTAAMRPSLTGLPPVEEIRRLVEERTPWYLALATLTLDTDGRTTDELADAIVAGLALEA